MPRRRLADVAGGLRRMPDRREWARTAVELAWALPLILLVAHISGLIGFHGAPDASTAAALAATLFVAPALGEKLLAVHWLMVFGWKALLGGPF